MAKTTIDSDTNIGHLIFTQRIKLNLSVQEVADQIDLEARYLWDIERNNINPLWSIVQKILQWIDRTS